MVRMVPSNIKKKELGTYLSFNGTYEKRRKSCGGEKQTHIEKSQKRVRNKKTSLGTQWKEAKRPESKHNS